MLTLSTSLFAGFCARSPQSTSRVFTPSIVPAMTPSASLTPRRRACGACTSDSLFPAFANDIDTWTVAEAGGCLDLHKAVYLHALSLQIYWPASLCIISLTNLVFPPQLLALALDIIAEEERAVFVQYLAGADRALAALPLKTVTIAFSVSRPLDTVSKDIDVSDELLPKMPLLASKLQGALRILEKM
ncbi:hypothetical protein C8R45DRAFT_82965 [Mycena sanguinolenta]|nr:hypothetical protein C8R45DRAFT_82965 [Mycena sanguinolenta]